MSGLDPIIVGVGQMIHKSEDFLHPLHAMKTAVKRAANDAKCNNLIDAADALYVVNIFSWNYRKAPRALAELLGINPALKEYTTIGGDTPQWLVNRVADRIALGENEISILAGCEVVHSVKCAQAAGKLPEGFRDSFVNITPKGDESEGIIIGNERVGNNDFELDHLMDMPVRIYPSGSFLVDSYTVWFDRQGEAESGLLMGRTASGKRALALTPEGNKDLLQAMMQNEWIGTRGNVIGQKGKINVVDF